jgi:hypothetical protein
MFPFRNVLRMIMLARGPGSKDDTGAEKELHAEPDDGRGCPVGFARCARRAVLARNFCKSLGNRKTPPFSNTEETIVLC